MADPRAEVITHRPVQMLTNEEVVAYWDEDRMAAAEPIPLDIPPNQDMLMTEDEAAATVQSAPAVSADSVPPTSSSAASTQPQPSVPSSGSNTQLVPQRPDQEMFPYQAVGKLFMTFGGDNYVGSAWTIAESGVFTAGHCVHNGEWAERLLFVPRYQDGSAPLGQWTFTEVASVRGWAVDRDFAYDVACFKTDRPIRPQTGSLGWMAHYPPNSGPYTGIGYPASPTSEHSFNGKHMWCSTGKYVGGSNPIQASNDMTQGCSGGPWATWRNGQVYANGLNSFRYKNDPQTMYSPYFGEAFINLYNWL